MTCKLSLGIQNSIDFDGFLDVVDFVRLFIQKYKYYSHNLTQTLEILSFSSKPLFAIILSIPDFFFFLFLFVFLFFIFKDSFFLFVKFIKSLYIFVIISCFLYRFCSLVWFLVFFYAMIFVSNFLYFLRIFFLWFVVFFVRFFSTPCFFSIQFLVFLAYFSFSDLFNFNRNSLLFLAS